MSAPLVSFVVVNWNGFEDTKLCVESIKKIDYSNFEIIVVDNGSTTDAEHLKKIDGINLICLPTNTGFTGGHIAGYKASKGLYIAIINNDLVLDQGWLKAALGTMGRHKKSAVVGGKNFFWNATNPAFDEKNGFFSYQEVDPATGLTRTLLTGEDECPVDSISGAALLIKCAALDHVGYFDNDFFAYYEETDLIARLKRAGYEAFYTPEAKAWHKVAASSSDGETGEFYLYMMHRNRYLYSLKNLDPDWVGRFKAHYGSEVRKHFLRWLLQRDLESRCRMKAYWWVIRHRKLITEKRKAVQKLGSSYVKHLDQHKPSDVTIVIPCYNYGNFVSEAIESALAQTLMPKKIIVINDGSTDNSQEIIDGYRHNSLVEVVHQKNKGIVDTKNVGLQKSLTYWTIFLDADDMIDPDYIAKAVKLANDGRYDVVYTDMEYFGAVHDVFRSRPFSLFPLLQRNFIHNSALIKTSLLKQVGGYKERMKDGLEDWELYLSLFEIGGRFGHIDQPIFKYRQHESTLSRNMHVQQKEPEIYQHIIDLHPNLFRHMGRTRRRLIRSLKFLYKILRYPGVWLIMVRSIPKALVGGFRVELHEIRKFFASKEKSF